MAQGGEDWNAERAELARQRQGLPSRRGRGISDATNVLRVSLEERLPLCPTKPSVLCVFVDVVLGSGRATVLFEHIWCLAVWRKGVCSRLGTFWHETSRHSKIPCLPDASSALTRQRPAGRGHPPHGPAGGQSSDRFGEMAASLTRHDSLLKACLLVFFLR